VRRDLGRHEAPGGLRQAHPLPPDPLEDLAHDPRLVQHHFIAGLPAAFGFADVAAIAVRGVADDAERARLRRVAAAAPDPLQERGSFVLGDDPLDLQNQLVPGCLANGAVEEHDLDPGPLELVDQHHLVRIAPGQAIGRVDVQPLESTGRREIPQPLERRADQARPAEAIVDEHELVQQPQAIGGYPLAQGSKLAGDRVGLRLVFRRDPRVDGGPHLGHQLIPPCPCRRSVLVVCAGGSRLLSWRRVSGTTCSYASAR
jgi:hypothetical protein